MIKTRRLYLFLLSLFLLSFNLFAQFHSTEVHSQVRVIIDGPEDVASLLQAGMEFDHIHPGDGGFIACLTTRDIAILDKLGRDYEILVPDLEAEYEAREKLSPVELKQLEKEMQQTYNMQGFGFGSMGGYYTFTEVLAELDSMRQLYPNLITVKQSIGTSLEGREIWMVKISDNPEVNEGEPEILYTSLHHSREPQSMATVLYFMYYLLENYGTDPDVTFVVNNRELYFVPVVNPDGYVYNEQTNPNGGGLWRKNRRPNSGGSFGVDLNRNYGYEWGYDNTGSSPDPTSNTYRGTGPFSEPESQVIRDFTLQHDFKLVFNYHSYSNLLIYPWGYIGDFLTPDSNLFVDLAVDMTQFNNYTYGTANQTVNYLVNGEANDWFYGEQNGREKSFAFTPEVGSFSDNFWPPPSRIFPLAQENVYPNMVLALGPGVIVADLDDPNPPSEVVAYSDFTTPNAIVLSWEDPTNFFGGDTLLPGQFTIEIERDGAPLATVNGGTEIYLDNGLIESQSYSYNLYTKVLATDSISEVISVSRVAGGSLTPSTPQSLSVVQDGNNLKLRWINPATNDDDTPLGDFAGVRLYENGSLVQTITRSSADTASADSVLIPEPVGTKRYNLTAIDNDSPINESVFGNTAFSPLSIPFQDLFPVDSVNGNYWSNQGAVVDNTAQNPPTGPFSLRLNGTNGGDEVTLLPVDLSGAAGQGYLLVFWLQPQGSQNAPESGDLFYAECLNDQGDWVEVYQQAGSGVIPFAQKTIALDSAPSGSGSFFHSGFRMRFRTASSPSGEFDDWYVDNVFLGPSNNNPVMTVSPKQLSEALLVGGSSSTSFNISNDNALPSSLNYSVSGASAISWLAASPESGVLSSNTTETIDLTIDATGLTIGNYLANLIVNSDDPANPVDTVEVQLSVQAAPEARIDEDSLLTRVLLNGEADTLSFMLYNDGGGDLLFDLSTEQNGNAKRKLLYEQKQKPTRKTVKGGQQPTFGVMSAGRGGPDPFGYTWIDSDEPDGPLYSFTDISATGTALSLTPTGTFSELDEGMATVTLPFPVQFYGNSFSEVQVNTNGVLIFNMNYFDNTFDNQGIPNANAPNLMVAPFWDDLDGSGGGTIYAGQVGSRFIIQWDGWGHYPAGPQDLTFQVVLFENSSTIHFVYENIDDQGSSTYGIENGNGSIGLEIAFNQNYAHDQLLVSIGLGADWLTIEPANGNLAAGDSLEVTAIGNATGLSPTTYRADILVNSNDPLNSELRLPFIMPVSGGAVIATSTDSVAFDSVRIGESETQLLTIQNNGSELLIVSDVLMLSSAFSVDSTEFSIAPGNSRDLPITFSPTDVVEYNGEMLIASNDPLMDTLRIALSGIGEVPVGIEGSNLPTEFALGENYPNPFNPSTQIDYQVPEPAVIRLAVFNILGQRVRVLFDGDQQPGFHTVRWDGRNDYGDPVGTGVYIYRLETRDFVQTRKMVLMK